MGIPSGAGNPLEPGPVPSLHHQQFLTPASAIPAAALLDLLQISKQSYLAEEKQKPVYLNIRKIYIPLSLF